MAKSNRRLAIRRNQCSLVDVFSQLLVSHRRAALGDGIDSRLRRVCQGCKRQIMLPTWPPARW